MIDIERTDDIIIDAPEPGNADIMDTEDELEDALRQLHEYRITDDREDLVQAHIAVSRYWFMLKDLLEETAQEVQ